jgi:hypothetical protein
MGNSPSTAAPRAVAPGDGHGRLGRAVGQSVPPVLWPEETVEEIKEEKGDVMRTRKAVLTLCASALLVLSCGSPPAVYGLQVTGFTTTSVSLAWSDNWDNEDGFRIYRSTDGTTFTQVGTSVMPSFQDNMLTQSQLYYYRVTVYKDTDESSPSNTVNVTPDDYYVNLIQPDGGENLTVGTIYNITWETNVPGFDATIRLSTDNGSTWTDILWSWYPNTSPFPWEVGYGWVDTDPGPGFTYEWQQIVSSTETDCLIYIREYDLGAVNDESTSTFTITVP